MSRVGLWLITMERPMEIDAREKRDAPSVGNALLFNMKTKKPIDKSDVDGLIDGLAEVKKILNMAYTQKDAFEDALFAHAKDLKTKTRRVQGERRIAKIEMPSDKQDGARLKKIVEKKEYKLIWPQLIRISGYAIKLREYKKAVDTKGTDQWNKYRDEVKSAITPPTSRPKITIEQ